MDQDADQEVYPDVDGVGPTVGRQQTGHSQVHVVAVVTLERLYLIDEEPRKIEDERTETDPGQ